MLAAGALKIDHQPPDCVLKDRFVLLEATVDPSDRVRKARAYFKSALDPDFYSVDMALALGRFTAKLPKPRDKAAPVTYYLEFLADDGSVWSIGPQGDVRWTYKTGGVVFSSPAIGPDGTVYVGSADGRLYAFR